VLCKGVSILSFPTVSILNFPTVHLPPLISPTLLLLLLLLLAPFRRDPPVVSNGRDFAVWMCRTHNAVNRRIGKPAFNCDLVAARWAPLDCDEHNSCDMTVGHKR
jgi:hypothetical protein